MFVPQTKQAEKHCFSACFVFSANPRGTKLLKILERKSCGTKMFVAQTFLCHNLKCDLATYPCGGRVGVAIADAGERDLDIGLKVDPQRR